MGLDFMHKYSGSFDAPMLMILLIMSKCQLIIPSEAGNKSALCLLEEYLLQLSSLTYLFSQHLHVSQIVMNELFHFSTYLLP